MHASSEQLEVEYCKTEKVSESWHYQEPDLFRFLIFQLACKMKWLLQARCCEDLCKSLDRTGQFSLHDSQNIWIKCQNPEICFLGFAIFHLYVLQSGMQSAATYFGQAQWGPLCARKGRGLKAIMPCTGGNTVYKITKKFRSNLLFERKITLHYFYVIKLKIRFNSITICEG